MKKIFTLLTSFLILLSCDDEEPELYTGLFIDIVGKWEIVSEAEKFYSGEYFEDPLMLRSDTIRYIFPANIGPEADSIVYLKYLDFKNIGSVSWDTEDGLELHYGFKWGVRDNKFWYSEELGEEHTEVTKLTDNEFHFTYTQISKNRYINYSSRQIITYKLKREL